MDAELPTSRSQSLLLDSKDTDDRNKDPHVTKEILDIELDEYFKCKQSTSSCPLM